MVGNLHEILARRKLVDNDFVDRAQHSHQQTKGKLCGDFKEVRAKLIRAFHLMFASKTHSFRSSKIAFELEKRVLIARSTILLWASIYEIKSQKCEHDSTTSVAIVVCFSPLLTKTKPMLCSINKQLFYIMI